MSELLHVGGLKLTVNFRKMTKREVWLYLMQQETMKEKKKKHGKTDERNHIDSYEDAEQQ